MIRLPRETMPIVEDPVEALASLPTAPRKESSVETVKRLRERIDVQVRTSKFSV